MAIRSILAMTGSEICRSSSLPAQIAWMSCRFSSENTGLSGMPAELPPGSMLIVNDLVPITDHDPHRVVTQLTNVILQNRIDGVLLDFQRPASSQAAHMATALVQALPCPVGIPSAYAGTLDCPVFLPPVPPHIPAPEYLQPWDNREIWLELALDATRITVTADGCATDYAPIAAPAENPHWDAGLHCHYSTVVEDDAIHFYLYRTAGDIAELLDTLSKTAVSRAIGLFQELG